MDTSNDTQTVAYVRGSGLGGGIAGLLYTIRDLDADGAVDDVRLNHYNGRGDLVAQTDHRGEVMYQAAYEAFGESGDDALGGDSSDPRTQTEGATVDRQRSNTKDRDPTGLINEWMRYREGHIFLTRDPIGFEDGINMYAYVQQNPYTFFDTKGLSGDPTMLHGALRSGYYNHLHSSEKQSMKDLGGSIWSGTSKGVINGTHFLYDILTKSAQGFGGKTGNFAEFNKGMAEGRDNLNERVDRTMAIAGVEVDETLEATAEFFAPGLPGLRQAEKINRINRAMNLADELAEGGPSVFRHVDEIEAEIAERTGFIPNTNRAQEPKEVFVSLEKFMDPDQAEDALRIGSRNPQQVTPPPTHVIEGDATNIKFERAGKVDGGTGTELITTEKISVKKVEKMNVKKAKKNKK